MFIYWKFITPNLVLDLVLGFVFFLASWRLFYMLIKIMDIIKVIIRSNLKKYSKVTELIVAIVVSITTFISTLVTFFSHIIPLIKNFFN